MNNGTTCPAPETINCPVDCILSEWSDWNACDCTTKKNTRVRKILKNANDNDLKCGNVVEIKNCTDNDYNQCLKSECEAKQQIFNLQTKKCEDVNVINIIMNIVNIIIVYILNLFKTNSN
jgi:hypothetical protein